MSKIIWRLNDFGVMSTQDEPCHNFIINRIVLDDNEMQVEIWAWEELDDVQRGSSPNVIRRFDLPIPEKIYLTDVENYFLSLEGIVSNNGETCNFKGVSERGEFTGG